MLGIGLWAKPHSSALERLHCFPAVPGVERQIMIGRYEEGVADAAERLNFTPTGTNWENIVDEVDVLYNLGPNAIHADPAIAALEAVASVFCEKPLVHTLKDAEQMHEAAKNAAGTAGIAFNYRFIPPIQYTKKLVDSGELGEVHHVRGQYP
nr:Gfo/Idh/MocA family oxidoreductase [Halostagnicola larsenii]